MARHPPQPAFRAPADGLEAPIADTPVGIVAGTTLDGIDRFLGIPYALPPVGVHRFRPAIEHPGWSGTLDATAFGPASAQVFDPLEAEFSEFGEVGPPQAWIGSEDSLTLNIWRPAGRDAPLPVLVWIHGGANWLESSRLSIYDGSALAGGGAVFVSFNYRLGVFGFLDLSSIGGPGGEHSHGLTDQAAALAWVAANIAAFGGDAGNITVIGESAGAMDIGWLLAADRLPAGVRRLVLMSGVASVVGLGWDGRTSAHDVAEGRRRADAFLSALGYRDIDALRAASTAEILTRQAKLAGTSSTLFDLDTLFYPRVEGIAQTDPFVAAQAGAARGLDVMIGFTAYEIGLWLLWDDGLDRRSLEWAAAAAPHLPDHVRGALPERYRAWFPDESDGVRAMHLLGDTMFAMPSLWLADLLADNGARVFAYRFDWSADARRRALHAADQAFLFGRHDTPAGRALLGAPRSPSDAAARVGLSATMAAALRHFAASGDPTTADLAWPAWSRAERAMMMFDTSSGVEADPLGERRAWWTANVLPRHLGGGA